MSLHHYKEAIRNIIDSTDDEMLLKHWKKQLEHDMENQDAIELTNE